MQTNLVKKILFIPMGIGLAHAGRLIVLSKELEKRGHKVFFGASKEIAPLLQREKLRFSTLPELSRESLENLKKLRLNFYSVKIIESFVKAELALYKSEKPDVVISDSRPTVKISTKIAKIPHITLNNANLSTFYDYSNATFPLPTFFLSEFLPSRLVNQLERNWMQRNVLSRVGPKLAEASFIEQLLKFNVVLQKFNQTPIRSLYNFFRGDSTLICDAHFFRPMKELPQDVVMVGPIFWQPNIKPPSWSSKIEERLKDGHKVIYVTAAGTGDTKIFKKVLETLHDFPSVVVATGGNAVDLKALKISKSQNLYLTDYLPGDWIMKNAHAVVFFGGNSTAYQALTNGTAQITIPLHVDQQDNANQLKRLGTTIILNPFKLSKATLLPALSEILYNPKYKKAALKYQKELESLPGKINAANEIEKFLSRPKNSQGAKKFFNGMFQKLLLPNIILNLFSK